MTDRAVEGQRVRPRAAALRAEPIAIARAYWPAIGFAISVAAVFFVHLPVLGHYFLNDDFVPLADISQRSAWGYIRDLFVMDDLTPNWRFLTGMVYLAEYRAFGLDASPYFLVSVLVHTATAGLLFWLLWRALDDVWPAIFGSMLFGLTAAHVPTVGQVTAFNNVLAAFLLLAAIVLLYEGLERRSLPLWLAASSVCFAGAIAANEASAVSAPVFGMLAVWKLPRVDGWHRDRNAWLRVALVSLPYAAMGVAALIGFGACDCTEANVYSRDDVFSNLWLYLGRLLYPIGLESPGSVHLAHKVAGGVVFAIALIALVRGPELARIGAAWLAIALVPYLPLGIWSAERYVYLASLPFAILGAVSLRELVRVTMRFAPAAPALLAFGALSAIGLLSWQMWEQNQTIAAASDRWHDLVAAIERSDIDPEPGSTVYLRGGPITDFLSQCTVMPALGQVLWDDVRLFTNAPDALQPYRVRPGYAVYVFDYQDGRFVPGPPPSNEADATALPHVKPETMGNLCAAGPWEEQ
ncbi:MAG: hypothetical protein WEB04_05450 [Dehalococcoidia bacterium]